MRCALRRIGLKNRDFTIISNNCWGGSEYKYFGLPFYSPFIGLFLREDDYVRLLENFEENMKLPLTFKPLCESKYPELRNGTYPMAVINGDIEIHFMHYKSEQEARDKWERRTKRIRYDNILFKLSERTECCSEEVQKAFITAPLKNRILLPSKKALPTDTKMRYIFPI